MSQFIEMFGNPLSLNQKNELKRLGECCILNPRRPNIALCDTDKVSFIPMPAVSEDGYWVDMTDEEYGKVKKGFTYFENNDVLFAKITPCMENGKGAIVHGLTNGIGMGSTEFHVLRPINGISSPYWLLALTRMPIFRERAAKNMSGTGGQKRVSASYLDHFMVGLPAIEEQRRFEAIYRQADKSKFGDFKSQFVEMFGNTPMSYEMQDCFSLIRNGANIKQGQFEGGIPITRIETISDEIVDRQKMGYAGIADNKYELYYLQDGDILISHINSLKHIGKCALYNKKENESIIHGMNLLCLRPNIVTINPVFAIHMLRSNIIRKGITDITKPAVNQASFSAKDFGKLRTIIPPMDKQMLFVSIAEQADKSKFGDFKSQFIEMFGNCKSQGTLSSLCATFIDGDWIESKDQSDNGIRLIQTGNVGFGFFKGREDKSRYITEETFKKLNCTEVVPGDILISRLPDPIGRACIVPEGIGKAITAVDCTIVRLNATLLPEFLISFSKTALYASQINKIKTGTTRLRVSRGNLGNVIIPIPPIESQHHFAAIAQQADKSKSVIQKALVYLNDIQSDELRKIA